MAPGRTRLRLCRSALPSIHSHNVGTGNARATAPRMESRWPHVLVRRSKAAIRSSPRPARETLQPAASCRLEPRSSNDPALSAEYYGPCGPGPGDDVVILTLGSWLVGRIGSCSVFRKGTTAN